MVEWRWYDACSDQAGDVGHVDYKVCANSVCDLAHAGVVDESAVGRRSCHKAFWAVELGISFEGVVVDDASVKVHAVWEGFKVG